MQMFLHSDAGGSVSPDSFISVYINGPFCVSAVAENFADCHFVFIQLISIRAPNDVCGFQLALL